MKPGKASSPQSKRRGAKTTRLAAKKLSKKMLTRIARLGDTDLRFWRKLLKSLGEEALLDMLQREEAAADKYRLWFPRLQQFAADCRRAAPIPDVGSFTAAERAQHRLLRARMKKFVRSKKNRAVLRGRPNRASVISVSRAGLPAAAEMFGRSGAVILSESDNARWVKKVRTAEGAGEEGSSWLVPVWWSVSEGLSDVDLYHLKRKAPPKGMTYWVVDAGMSFASWAGGGSRAIYAWDGRRAKRILELDYVY
jgi:hypothetical protein